MLFGDNFNGKDYSKPGVIKGCSIHIIRVTSMTKPEDLEPTDKKLYNLIYDLTVTSHMKPCINLIYKISIVNDWIKDDGYFTASHKG